MVMAFVVLLSTLSFTLNMHYCGETLVETAVFHKAKGCGMEFQNSSIEGCAITKTNCCNDKQLLIDGQDELQLKIDKVSFEQQIFLATLVFSYINLFEGSENRVTTYQDYKPPLVIRQLYKIDETYLI